MRSFFWIPIFLATQASAGPWSRDQGKSFLSYSASARFGASGVSNFYGSAYYEYGLPYDLTIGANAGSDTGKNHKAILFLRSSPGGLTNGQLVAVEVGAGVRSKHTVLYTGVTTGKGTKIAGMNAWWTLDGRTYLPIGNRKWAFESELTLGLKPNDRTKTILQIQSQKTHSSSMTMNVEGMIAYKIAPGVHLTASANAGVLNSKGLRLGLGMWHEF